MDNTRKIDDLIPFLERAHKEKRELIISFGSEAPLSDIDLLVVSLNATSYEQIRFGNLDVTIIPLDIAINLAHHFDILLTNSLLNGKILILNEFINSKINYAIENPMKIKDIITHHLLKAMRCRLTAQTYIEALPKNEKNNELAEKIGISLSWACSYFISAIKYNNKEDTKPLSFNDLVQHSHGSILLHARSLTKKYEKTNKTLNHGELIKLAFQIDKEFILENKKSCFKF